MIKRSMFGVLPDGKNCYKYSIYNSCGEHVELLNVGASLHAIFVRDRDGHVDDVTLGVPDVSGLTGFSRRVPVPEDARTG